MAAFQRGKLIERREIYSGSIVDLVVDQIEVHDAQAVREVVRHPGGVVVLVELPDRRIPFVRQHRYPIEQDLLELPAGKLDPGEEPSLSAARELEEETGFRARSLELICKFHSSPGFCDELLHFFYTREVEKTSRIPEHGEELVVEFYTLEEAIRLGLAGEILDAKTLVALFWLHWKRTL